MLHHTTCVCSKFCFSWAVYITNNFMLFTAASASLLDLGLRAKKSSCYMLVFGRILWNQFKIVCRPLCVYLWASSIQWTSLLAYWWCALKLFHLAVSAKHSLKLGLIVLAILAFSVNEVCGLLFSASLSTARKEGLMYCFMSLHSSS